MSNYQLTQNIYASNLKSRAVLVMNYLIYRSNKENTCFPSIKTIAKDVHVSINTVKRALRDLIIAGFIKKEARFVESKNGAQTSNLFTLLNGNAEINKKVNGKNGDEELKDDSENDTVQNNGVLKLESVENDLETVVDSSRQEINDKDIIKDKTDEKEVKKEKKNKTSEELEIHSKYKFYLGNFVNKSVLTSIKRATKVILSKLPTNGGLPPRPM